MKLLALWLPLALALPGQDPNAIDRFREQLDRTTLNPATDLSDPAARSREALRLPLNADPSASLAEIQAAQTSLIRLNDILNAQAERAALTRQLAPDTPIVLLPRPLPVPRRPASSPNLALAKPTRQSSVRYFGSRGGVDGRITGTFGFYTEREASPWWQVDLEQSPNISEIRIYNSRINPEHARTLRILLSIDGQAWKTAYTHDASIFGANGRPLRVPLHGAKARWVRLQLSETNFLHLDEVEIY